ncbi:MAG: peptide-methionine (S)-S-oxide reductase MsrA [Candidatus Melainabacteria bacterium]|nr:peptide-methionine (S)-S-oxide reductase MsrA [Candidatus Melainabacteria bacterium]
MGKFPIAKRKIDMIVMKKKFPSLLATLTVAIFVTSFSVGCSKPNVTSGGANDAAAADTNDNDPKVTNLKGTEKAMLAAGCFWHVESGLQNIPGVVETTVGYTGGTTKEPTYVSVCAGKTGHAEAVEVSFDPKKVSYETILNKFFDEHDPTTVDAKRSYHGGQYRSEIFYYNDEQKKIAESVKAEREKKHGKPFFTEIEPVAPFTIAEDFHQDYLKIRGLNQCR